MSQVQSQDYLEMSDEELLNAGPPVEFETWEEPEQAEDDDLPEPSYETEDSDDEGQEDPQTDFDNEEDGDLDEGEQESDDALPETNEPETSTQEPESTDVDYQSVYNQIFSPFKANGKEMKVDSVEDVVSLMQMGANYNKKMAALKPNLRLLKMLENQGLLSEAKIGYLIDLDKKDPGAITKLVSESGIDPLDIDTAEASAYKPNTYTVTDKEIELDTVLEELSSTPTYNRTLQVVSTKWDGASKREVSNNPQILRVINDHIASGIYDLVEAEIEKERAFGRLEGITDLEAYRLAGDAIEARGGFNHLIQQPATSQPVPQRAAPRSRNEDAIRDKKRAASSTRSSAPSRPKGDFDPLSMSDEEFEKVANAKFL